MTAIEISNRAGTTLRDVLTRLQNEGAALGHFVAETPPRESGNRTRQPVRIALRDLPRCTW